MSGGDQARVSVAVAVPPVTAFEILTGEIDHETARRAAEIEPAGYLIKPVHGNQLVTAVRRAMSTAGMDLTAANCA